jgi:hypothetical protein
MGNSVQRHECVNIEDIKEITDHTYTVLRSSGELQEGWAVGSLEWQHPHAYKKDGVWRISMVLEDEASGWRRIETIAPSEMAEDPVATNAWRSKVIAILDEREAQEQEDDSSEEEYEEVQCGLRRC